jgi:hypothetical protein
MPYAVKPASTTHDVAMASFVLSLSIKPIWLSSFGR